MKRGINFETVRWIYRYSGKEKRNIVLLTLIQGCLGISTVVFAWLLRGAIDQATEKNGSGFFSYAVGMVVLVVLQITFRALDRFLREYTVSGLENRFKARLFGTLLAGDYAGVTGKHSGEWMNRLTSDAVVVANGMTEIIPDAMGMLVKMIGAVMALLILVPEMGWYLIPGGCVLLLCSALPRRTLKRLHAKIQEEDGALRVFLAERLAGLLVVRSFAGEAKTEQAGEELMKLHRKARMKRCNFSNVCNVGLSIVVNGVYMVAVLYCGHGILLGTVSYGSFMAVLQLIGQVQSPFVNLSGYLPKFYGMLASAERLMEAEQYKRLHVGEVYPLTWIKEFYENKLEKICLRDASFTYTSFGKDGESVKADRQVVLRDIHLTVNKGDCVAFVGPSGSGKSTIMKLLMSLYSLDSGERYMESRDGKRLCLDERYIRLFAYVPQGNYLMSDTIRNVIAFSETEQEQDERRIRWALEVACALEFVEQLPKGLDTELGERGAGLSEGQMQRIAVARALFSGSPILLLDEATSALDEATEQRLIQNLRRMTECTILLVTHRQAMLDLCNKQVMVKDNRIEVIEHGTE